VGGSCPPIIQLGCTRCCCRAVLIGYIHGVAVVLVVGQLGKLLGLDIDAQDPLPQLAEVAREVGGLSGATVAVGIACLAPLLLLRWRAPKIPGPLVVVVLAIVASAAIGLAEDGVAVVGEIPPGLPGIELPSLHLTDVLALLPAALGIFFVSFSDEILTARSFGLRRDPHHQTVHLLRVMTTHPACRTLDGENSAGWLSVDLGVCSSWVRRVMRSESGAEPATRY
jgi:MFS superfamily sulfate permease-like transporter